MAHMGFPPDLPIPKDDGACSHLKFEKGFMIPSIPLPVARNPSQMVDISTLKGLTIVFCYPRTGGLNETIPASWNAIPGARGCTPQACSFRDAFPLLTSLGVSHIYGVSTQSPSYQAEVHERLQLPYDLLSDKNLTFRDGMKLPTFEWDGTKVLRRVTLAIKDGKVVMVWYPVFPPDGSAREVVDWLEKPENAKVAE